MTLRAKLLLLALLTLVLPLAGWLLARQFELLLREGQEQVQLASARMLARAVEAQAQELPAAGPGLFVQPASGAFVLDGYDADWRDRNLAIPGIVDGIRLALAQSGDRVYQFIAVRDSSRIRADANWAQAARADQVVLVLEDDAGLHRLRLASAAPGALVVQPLEEPPGRAPQLVGYWQEDASGYQVELRYPAGYRPARMGIEVLDFGDPALPPQRRGTDPALVEGRWAVQYGRPALQELLENLVPGGMRVSLVQDEGWVLARAGDVERLARDGEPGFWYRLLHRLLVPGRPAPAAPERGLMQLDLPEMWQALGNQPALAWYSLDGGRGVLLATVAPVRVGGQVRAALILERPSESLLLGGRALAGLLLASVLAMSVVGLGLFAFAGHLGARIRTLSRAAERAIAREGHDARAGFVASTARDELGDLSRSFGRLLEEVEAYADYLRGLAGTLSHELHTPIAVVRSSLENLDAEVLPEPAQTYVERARAGVDRLAAIVRAMSEASRMERAVAVAESEEFDLRALVADCAEGYRALLLPRRLQTMLPPAPLMLRGAPDLIVQALDKLVDNARSFCPADGWVLIGLARTGQGVELVVANAGPGLPEGMQERLFDSLVSLRGADQRGDGQPHLGFGLHLVRLVAQRHGGFARAANLPNGDGVEFRLVLHGMDEAGLA